MEHEMTMSEIADALFKAGLHKEYKAMKRYMKERSAFIDQLKSIEIFGHDAGSPISIKE